MTVITSPTPPYQNPPIEPQYYLPNRFVIANITEGPTTFITTTTPQNYVVGQLIRLIIPQQNGAQQLNNQQAFVIGIQTSTEVEIALYTVGCDPFIASPANPSRTSPQILAIGDVNTGAINTMGRINNGTFIPGSFIDISPK